MGLGCQLKLSHGCGWCSPSNSEPAIPTSCATTASKSLRERTVDCEFHRGKGLLLWNHNIINLLKAKHEMQQWRAQTNTATLSSELTGMESSVELKVMGLTALTVSTVLGHLTHYFWHLGFFSPSNSKNKTDKKPSCVIFTFLSEPSNILLRDEHLSPDLNLIFYRREKKKKTSGWTKTFQIVLMLYSASSSPAPLGRTDTTFIKL